MTTQGQMEGSPSTLYGQNFMQTRTYDNEVIRDPLYGDWLHTSFNVARDPPDYPPKPVNFPPLSFTTQGIVVMCIPSLLQPPHIRSINSSFYCWTNTSTESTSNPQQEIAKSIVTQYQRCMPKMALAARVNPTVNDFKTSLSKVKKGQSEARTLFHYSSHGAPDISSQFLTLHSADKLSFDHFPIDDVLSATESCSVHIIDCDFSGSLLHTYQLFMNEHDDAGKHMDLYAFFACGIRERLPRSPGLPHDIFTSCMTTPAQMALLWHSRHYYCFKNGPLRPLDLDFFLASNPAVLDDIGIILHRLVEAMAFEVFEPELFMRVFRSDSSIAHLAANFFLAARILSFFNVHPLSIPQMPDLLGHQLWHTFDLRLDVALQQLSAVSPEPSLTYTAFLEQNLTTLSYLMNVATREISFPGQLTLIPPALTTASLQSKAAEILALYIDKSAAAVRQMYYFPIIVPLFQLLEGHHGSDFLLLSIAKALCYMPSSAQVLIDISGDPFKSVIFPLLTEERPLFALVVAANVSYFSPASIRSVLEMNWPERLVPLVASEDSDVRLWVLLFMASFVGSVESPQQLKFVADTALQLTSDDTPEVRIAALHTLVALVGKGCNEVVASAASLVCTDPNEAVRCELIILLENLLDADPQLAERDPVKQVIPLLVADPNPGVERMMRVFGPRRVPSTVFKWFAQAVLSPIRSILEDRTKTLANVQPSTVQIKNAVSPRRPNSAFTKLVIGPKVDGVGEITSNFANAMPSSIAFGTRRGDLVTLSWDDCTVSGSKRISQRPLTSVDFLSNFGYPLIAAADDQSNVHFVTADGLREISAFRVSSMHDHIAFAEADRTMFTFNPRRSNKIAVYDMTKEKIVDYITPFSGNPRSVRPLERLSDIVAICADRFELIDLRASAPVVSCEWSTPAFDVSPLDKSTTLFTLANTQGVVSMLDVRFPEPIKRFQLGPEETETLSFAAQTHCPSVAIGTARGAHVLDFNSGRHLDFTQISQLFVSRDLLPVQRCLFAQHRFRVAIQQDSAIQMLVESS